MLVSFFSGDVDVEVLGARVDAHNLAFGQVSSPGSPKNCPRSASWIAANGVIRPLRSLQRAGMPGPDLPAHGR